MIRINLMPFEERSQKTRRPQAARKSGGASGVLLPLAIIAGVLVLIVGTIVQQQAQLHMLTNEVARVERESQALAPQIAKSKPIDSRPPRTCTGRYKVDPATRSLLSRLPPCQPGGRLEILPMSGGGATPIEPKKGANFSDIPGLNSTSLAPSCQRSSRKCA